MSFISSEDHFLALNLWPITHSEMIAVRAGPKSLSGWEQFPRDLEGMFNWATIAKDASCTDKSRENIVIYRNPPTPAPDAMYPISVRLYGCLQSFNVGKFGNWDGYGSPPPHYPYAHQLFPYDRDPSTAMRATQSITLTSGGHDEAWQNQLDNLNIASAFASRMINWEWNDALPILQITPTHECIPLHEILLNRFDFVEVDAEFNLVVSRPTDGSPTLKFFLSFKHLVRLLDASTSKVLRLPCVSLITMLTYLY
ncbi:hypothetical protein EDD15DRAFT_2172667 [Pisolithus albus]|nr:hypothetical protein EDD15DRAFT_2172667 [Pisolithus albus]